MSAPRDRFERLMADCDTAEAAIRHALAIFDEAIALCERLPFPLRPIMVWIGKAKRRPAEAHLLRLETTRAGLIGIEHRLRAMPPDLGPWER